MAKTSDSIVVGLDAEQTFSAVTDLKRFPDWLIFHKEWNGAVPEQSQLGVGTEVSSVIDIKGTAIPVGWTVDAFDSPRDFSLSGKVKGVKMMVRFQLAPDAGGTALTLELEVKGLAVAGPIGKAVVGQVHGDVQESLERFKSTFA